MQKNYNGQAAAGQATFDFNGGLLQATASSPTFMQGIDNAYVLGGGAVIDTQGFNITIGAALQTSPDVVFDGGLAKYGSGTLVLTGNNTFNGPTTISAGTLQVSAGGATGQRDRHGHEQHGVGVQPQSLGRLRGAGHQRHWHGDRK